MIILVMCFLNKLLKFNSYFKRCDNQYLKILLLVYFLKIMYRCKVSILQEWKTLVMKIVHQIAWKDSTIHAPTAHIQIAGQHIWGIILGYIQENVHMLVLFVIISVYRNKISNRICFQSIINKFNSVKV